MPIVTDSVHSYFGKNSQDIQTAEVLLFPDDEVLLVLSGRCLLDELFQACVFSRPELLCLGCCLAAHRSR